MATSTTGGTVHTHESLTANLFDVGIFKDTLLPSFTLTTGITLAAYLAGRATNTVCTKDVVFPANQLANAWWSAVFRRVYHYGLPLSQVIKMQSRPERLLLAGVTLWSGYKLVNEGYKYFSRPKSSTDDDKDDPKYRELKQEDGFWNKSLLTLWLPEAIASTLIALPYTAPFRHQGAVLSGYHPIGQSTAVGMFAAGFALEALSDYQAAQNTKSVTAENETVWSVLSNPKNLASTLVTLSFPVLLYSSDMLAPVELLGPLTYYLFHRYTATKATPEGDFGKAKATAEKIEQGQVDYKNEAEEKKDSIVKALQNKWVLAVLGLGTAIGLLEGFTHGPMVVEY